jgi:parallel beta-helix repeat protein
MNARRIALAVSLLWIPSIIPAAAATFEPGPNAQEAIQEALILAEPGDTIEFAAGKYDFTSSLSLDVDNVTLRGAGMDETIFSFKNQNAGSEGIIVTSDGVRLEGFAVEDAIGDAIKVKGAKGITFYKVRTEWTNGPHETNGAYGFYPVESTDVLIDRCIAIGASDAGIYVGQSRNVIVRNSIAKYNVAGIEIENCYNADVIGCLATRNTGGILVFDLHNLPQQGGHNIRVLNSQSINNDTKNFAPEGNIVGLVPTGTGMIVMANHNVEIFDNVFSGNSTGNLFIRRFIYPDGSNVDANYYPYPSAINIHHNRFTNGGYEPMGVRGKLFQAAAKTDALADIVWDGSMDPKKAKNGKLPAELGIYLYKNKKATFINLDLDTYLKDPAASRPSRDKKGMKGSLPSLPPITIPGDHQSTD